MLIDEKKLGHWIKNFYGYGSWRARFWFIAHEESGGDLPEEVADKLNYFDAVHGSTTNPTLCDLREMYKALSPLPSSGSGSVASYEYRFGSNAVLNSVWKNLTLFTHGYAAEAVPDLLEYQRNSFAAQKEALIRLYPLPSPHNHAWYYSWLDMPQLPFLKSRTLYQDHVYENRMQTILTAIGNSKPELVLMYGMSNINRLKESVLAFFPSAKFKAFKAVRQQIPQHHTANLNGTTLVVTTQIPALRHNRVETGFDWERFGRVIGDR